MTDNNKHLVRVGHEFAAAMSDDTPIITIAKMVTKLASALDVQTARSEALAAALKASEANDADARCHVAELEEKCAAMAAELEAAEKSNSFLKGQLAELANFNPDWDKLEASYESWREIAAELLVAKDRIAELEQRLNIKPCPKCNDTGMADSGGAHPWGEPIEIECDCRQHDANIAELEERTVTLPKASQAKLQSGEFIHCWPAYTVDSAIRAAGIKCEVNGE
ncbi:hypothetical protein [Atlantibacter hermannii]|uniref:hypothetical protein n=1 Tax=Atlantibacter hermannii TaxID=565 RepID=UPI0028B1130E|nr:hypothetical protein [Atlantibacter hermannii]